MQSEPSDVLNEFRQGSVAAFETLFRLHQRAVYGWILRIVRNPATTEDLTVETFWRIYRAHARFQPSHGFEAWARRIATNAALDWLKRARPETELDADRGRPSHKRGASRQNRAGFSAIAAEVAHCGDPVGRRGTTGQRNC